MTERPITMTIELQPAVETKGGQLKKLDLREPLAGHVAFAEQHLAQRGAVSLRRYQTTLVAKAAGIEDETTLDGVPISTFTRAARHLHAFVNVGVAEGVEDGADSEESAAPGAPAEPIALDPPLEFRGVDYSNVELREPTLEQMRKAESALKDMAPHQVREYQILLVHHASGLPLPVVRMLPISTFNRVAARAQGFTAAGRETGPS